MNERDVSITFSTKLDNLTEHNASFDKGVLRICYVGKNNNNSFISKDTLNRCISTMFNCPVVCRYDREEDEIGAHDVSIVQDGDTLRIVNDTAPIGVIPESANYWFEVVEEEDGTLHEYLCAEALLWKRQDAYRKIKEDGVTAQSMEIYVKSGGMSDGLYVIDDFEFKAFCLLGTAKPCYESAALIVFSRENFRKQLDEMMSEYKESLFAAKGSIINAECVSSAAEGGEKALEMKKALMSRYGLTEDALDFNLEDFSEEELTAKFESIVSENKFALSQQIREGLHEALGSEKVDTEFGELPRYWYVDYDEQASEVYCTDFLDWKLYGFSYSMNGDNVIVDFESKKKKKFAIVDFDEGEQPALFSGVYSEIVKCHTEAQGERDKEFAAKDDAIAALTSELEGLKAFKANIAREETRQELLNVFAKFEDLADIEAFKTLQEDLKKCEDVTKYSVEAIEEKCYAIRGRTKEVKFSAQETKPPVLIVEKHDMSAEPYGGVFAKYGIDSN